MPEGDTIHRSAARLRPALAGAQLQRFEAQRLVGARPRIGETIDMVEAHGKHLLMGFSGGLTLETHMRMTGSWHLYRSGERWRKPAHLVRVRIDVPDWVALCFTAPIVRTFPTAALGTTRSPLVHLGPDLCLPNPDFDACLERIEQLEGEGLVRGATDLAEVLLDQRVGNVIGNVYKSEVCWAERVNPFTPLRQVDRTCRRALLGTANRLLMANLGAGQRTTVSGGLAVYGRRGQPCRRCSTPIERRTQGELARVTFWCPTCQPAFVGAV